MVVITEKNRLRWQCTKVGSCRCPRTSVLKDSPWFSNCGSTPARKVAILVLAHLEGLSQDSAAAIANVELKTVTMVQDRIPITAAADAERLEEPAPKQRKLVNEPGSESDSDSCDADAEMSDFEALPVPKGGAVHFESTKYRAHEKLMPEIYVEPASRFMTAHKFEDQKLWFSILSFLFLLLACQAPAFADYNASTGSALQQQLLQRVQHYPQLHRHVMERALEQGALPAFDAKLRGRSVQALKIFTTLYAEAAAT